MGSAPLQKSLPISTPLLCHCSHYPSSLWGSCGHSVQERPKDLLGCGCLTQRVRGAKEQGAMWPVQAE